VVLVRHDTGRRRESHRDAVGTPVRRGDGRAIRSRCAAGEANDRYPPDAHDADRASCGGMMRGVNSSSQTHKTYHLTTFGCQMNEHDSERMKGMLQSLGYEQAQERGEADLILFNTCSIRESADSRFITHLGEAKRLKRERPGRLVGVGGCWAQSVKEEVFERFPFVDVAFGPGQVHKLAEFLTSDSLSAQGYFEFEGFTGHLPAHRERRFQGWLQISVGCNCACSYCIVPSTRGREVSRPAQELVAEVQRMAGDGVREVTLLGQNVNSYGRDLHPRTTFAELLEEVDGIDGIERIRYTSPHPKDMREDVVLAHARLASVCEHIHLPLQSGSSRVLKEMRRTYDRRRYLDRVAMIREHLPDVSLSTDIIVGFPGETEQDFQQTLDVVEQVRFDSAFTFLFSARRGTQAAAISEGLVPHQVKVERMQRLVDLVQAHARTRAQRFVGRTLEVLVEGASRTDPERLRGRTRHNKVVNFAGLATPGELTEVEITGATSQTLAGEERLLARTGLR
jgi:tRNA-2-methylthio-N6-dimethylallyladenosine synthase